ncbi:MAG TPA: response regulator [Flavitalea sp.]|nr:response regulator [Flavitalea sp.]
MILIVDDNHENLFSLKSLLQLHLHEVDTASSGEEALKKILRKEYALVILDVQMPEMDGYEVAEAVTGLNKTKDIPIIFLSAVNIDKRFITKGYDSGAVDYVTKPFDPDLLLLKVKTFCRLYEQTRELKSTQETLKKEIESRKLIQKEIERINLSLEEKVQQRTKELVRVNQDLETRNAELAQYASLASHDLQEPLRKIVTFSRILDDKYLATMPEAHKYMIKVINSAERMRSLIDDLLNYSKLSVQLQFSKLDLNEILATTLADLEILIEEKGAEVTISRLPKIEAVAGQMRQLFQNLISNALKFSKTNSIPKVKIWSELVSEKSFNAVPSSNGEFVRIFIEDNGIGFNEVYLDKIFTIFQRLHVRSDYEGTGIGLAIVKKIVEKHDGIIGAKSTEGVGATFFIILPIHQKNTQVTAA